MFRLRWRRLGAHYHCRVFAQSSKGNYAKIGELTMDEKDFVDFQLSVLAKHWDVLPEGEVDLDEQR